MTSGLLDMLILGIAVACGLLLLSRKVRTNKRWRATVTPLASIIGSGFLVVVPLLGHSLGGYAPIAMLSVVVFAFAVGAAIRFNITRADKVLSGTTSATAIARLEATSGLVLAGAYFISVAFYLRLLSAFALHGLGVEDEIIAQVITTAILVFLGTAGWLGGLAFLERLEQYSVSIKLAIIAALVVGWAAHDVSTFADFDLGESLPADLDAWYILRLVAGVLIVVQGFETSRYLGDQYDAATRASTMRNAQIISGVIYVLFVALCVPSMGALGDEVSETAVIDLSRSVAVVLPAMLVVAALMSQLSAAVADTVGAGGLFTETVAKHFRLPPKYGYALVSSVGILLVWTTDIFVIISLASRAFAIYYALQSMIAALMAHNLRGPRRLLRVASFALLSGLLFFCAVVAIPAG